MTLPPLVLTEAQSSAVRRIIMEPTRAALIAAQTGSGKTVVAVEVCRMLGHKIVMISAPLHTHDGWTTTIQRQIPGAEVYTLNNTTKAGREGMARLSWGTPGFYLVSREFWRLQDWSKVEVDMLIHDECHTLANRKNSGSRLARRVAKGWLRTKWTLLMSATPFGSSFAGAWSIGRILWGDLVDRVPVRWEADWCRSVYDPHAARAREQAIAAGRPGAQQMSVAKIVGEKDPGAFVASLPCYIYFEGDSSEPPRPIDIRVELSRAQRKLYNDFEEKGVAWLEDHPLVETIPIVKRIRLRQLTLGEGIIRGTGKLDEFGDEIETLDFADDCRSTKLDTLQEILGDEAQGQKVLIATDSKKFAKVVARRVGGYAWTGDETQKQRADAKNQFIDGDLQYIVATQASISEGTDGLQIASHMMVILSENDSDMLNTQMLGRLARRGQTKQVIVYRIIANNTYDDPQAKTLLMKKLEMRASLRAKVVA